MLATFKFSGTVGFVMYVSDSFGYLGSVATLFAKEFGSWQMDWLEFFMSGALILSIAGSTLIACSGIYFIAKYKRTQTKTSTNSLTLNAKPSFTG
jgi:hypothetical protein